MALLFVMAVFMTVLYTTPEMLIATVISLANEGSKMTEIPSLTMLFFKPVVTVISAIACSCVAVSLLAQFPAPSEVLSPRLNPATAPGFLLPKNHRSQSGLREVWTLISRQVQCYG
ncbi:hypothetical protein [Pseudomonas sp. B10]|uniref:hypothetical protein n=1 Tax=Pseudomonas sp. B10 TaxID=118613 RepID=UPI00097037D7|nr:hypothetical protein [Pseudomonas sp. B10]